MKKSIGQKILIEVGRLITPFEEFDNKEEVVKVLNEVGFDIKSENLNINLKPLKEAIQLVKKVLKELDELEDEKGLVNKIKELAEKLKPAIEKIKEALPAIKKAVKEIQDLSEDAKLILDQLPKRILDYIIYVYIEEFHPKIYSIANINGIAELTIDSQSKTIRTIKWSRIPKVLSKPHKNIAEVYNWNDNFKSEDFLNRLNNLLPNFSIAGDLYTQDELISQQLGYFEGSAEELRFPILQKGVYSDEENENTYGEIGLNISPIPRIIDILVDIDEYRGLEEEGEPFNPEDFIDELDENEYNIVQNTGLFIYPNIQGNLNLNEDLSDTWKLNISGNLDLGAGFGIAVRPEEKIKIKTSLFSEEVMEVVNSSLDIKLVKKDVENEFVSLAGEYTDKGLFIGYKDFEFGSSIGSSNGEYELKLETLIHSFTFRIDGSKGDGFIQKILSNLKIESITDLGIGFSNHQNVYFIGQPGLELSMLERKKIGPLDIRQFLISINFDNNISFQVKTSFNLKMGPVIADLDKLGMGLDFGFPEKEDGNYGPVDGGTFDFLSPKRIGLTIKGKVITGAGFLESDPDNYRYSGILSLQLKAIDLTAIGLISTRLPNNKKGFSMLVNISTIFRPPIQLSFGFTLNGVGGLIGVNRTMKVDELRNRLANGAIKSIMFPKDVIENADRIISDLRAVFPSKDKHFIVAPFLRIGWGSTAIVEADLGILLEFPFKNRVILIGGLGIYLPTKDVPLTKIRIDVLGDFNFAEEYIRLEGVIRDSHVVGIPLSGGFAFVLSWDRRPQFLLSVGGYHPRYKRPVRFPDIARLKAVIKYGKNFSLTCEYYQAITSNSFQIGFKADLWAKAMGAKIKGYFGFNALLQFDPFYFETDVSMGVKIKYKRWNLAGVDLFFMLSGPKPWKVKGHAKIKVAFFKVKIKFKKTWGGKQKAVPTTIEPTILLNKLQTQLALQSSWSSKLPNRFKTRAILRKIEEEAALILHPSGYLECRQTVVPLNRTIQKYGNSIVNKSKYQITNVKFGSKTYKDRRQLLKEYFAVGQYKELSDAKKISSPDFELMDAGYAFGGVDDFDFGTLAIHDTDSRHEEIELGIESDSNARSFSETTTSRPWSASRMNINRSARIKRYREENEYDLVEQIWFDDDEKYLIINKMDFSLPNKTSIETPFDTKMDAENYMETVLLEMADDYEIMTISDYEILDETENSPEIAYNIRRRVLRELAY